MRDEKTGRPRLPGGKAEAARRRQVRFLERANDEGKALRPQPFFNRVQSLARPRRLDDDEPRRIEPEAAKPRSRRRAEFPSKRPWPAPQNPRPRILRPACRRQLIDPANGKASGKPDPSHPIGSRRPAKSQGLAFDLVEGVRLQSGRQKRVRRRTSKPPAVLLTHQWRKSRRRDVFGSRSRHGRCPQSPSRSMPLQAQNTRTQPLDDGILCGVCRKAQRGKWSFLTQRNLVIQRGRLGNGGPVPMKMFYICSNPGPPFRQVGSDKKRIWLPPVIEPQHAVQKFLKPLESQCAQHNHYGSVTSLLCRGEWS